MRTWRTLGAPQRRLIPTAVRTPLGLVGARLLHPERGGHARSTGPHQRIRQQSAERVGTQARRQGFSSHHPLSLAFAPLQHRRTGRHPSARMRSGQRRPDELCFGSGGWDDGEREVARGFAAWSGGSASSRARKLANAPVSRPFREPACAIAGARQGCHALASIAQDVPLN